MPSEPFSPKKVVVLTVQRNYHVQLSENHHYYSVPYQYVGKKVKVRYDHRAVEVYLNTERIALHVRKPHCKAYTTLEDHMPPHHQRMQTIKARIKKTAVTGYWYRHSYLTRSYADAGKPYLY